MDAPLVAAFQSKGLTFAGGLITLGILAGMTSSLLVGNLSQPRILLAMARDGLLPPEDLRGGPPAVQDSLEIDDLVGVVVAAAAALAPLAFLAELVSIGNCSRSWLSRRRCGSRMNRPDHAASFPGPFIHVVSAMGILVNGYMMVSLGRENWTRLGIWLVLGLLIYFGYRRKHSLLGPQVEAGHSRVAGT